MTTDLVFRSETDVLTAELVLLLDDGTVYQHLLGAGWDLLNVEGTLAVEAETHDPFVVLLESLGSEAGEGPLPVSIRRSITPGGLWQSNRLSGSTRSLW